MKTGRNQLCNCGSGKKFKHCCGNDTGSARVPPTPEAKPTTEELNRLVTLLNQGRYAELERQAQMLLARFPNLGFAWKVIGVALQMQGNDGLPALAKAAELLPNEPDAHSNLGNALRAAGRLEEAVVSFRRALLLKPDFAEAHNNLGNALHGLKLLDEARQSYQHAIALLPNYAEAHSSLGNVLQALGNLDGALASCSTAVALKPEYAAAHNNLGNVLHVLGKYTEAAASYRRALAINPLFAEAHNNLGNVLCDIDELDESLESYRRAIAIRPLYLEAYSNVANVLHALGRFEEAKTNCRTALEIDPDYADALINLGIAQYWIGELDEAELSLGRAKSLAPQNVKIPLNLGYVKLTRGCLVEGWEGFEQRLSEARKSTFLPPCWAGEDLKGKSIAIWREQGIGDEILFASMYADTLERSGQCVIECSSKLLPLFARTFPSAKLVTVADPPDPALQAANYQCAAGSLARWVRPTIDHFPQHRGYLTPSPERSAYWKSRLGEMGKGMKVGICWRSGLNKGSRALQYSTLDQWGPVFAIPGVHFVNLQYDDCADEIRQAQRQFGVDVHAFPEVDLFNDLDEAAALTQSLDLVISAATAACSLAAALGLPTWMMSFGSSWTSLGADHSPWYPDQRGFERRTDQSWDDVIDTIAEQLQLHSTRWSDGVK